MMSTETVLMTVVQLSEMQLNVILWITKVQNWPYVIVKHKIKILIIKTYIQRMDKNKQCGKGEPKHKASQ